MVSSQRLRNLAWREKPIKTLTEHSREKSDCNTSHKIWFWTVQTLNDSRTSQRKVEEDRHEARVSYIFYRRKEGLFCFRNIERKVITSSDIGEKVYEYTASGVCTVLLLFSSSHRKS